MKTENVCALAKYIIYEKGNYMLVFILNHLVINMVTLFVETESHHKFGRQMLVKSLHCMAQRKFIDVIDFQM